MLKHADIWQAIDALAAAHSFSPSGLARVAGLDATTFNKSKRLSPEGKQRWPSTESIAKILEVTGASFLEFAALVHKTVLKTKIPVLPLATLVGAGRGKGEQPSPIGEDGKPAGKGWGKRSVPGIDDENAFGLEVSAGAAGTAQAPGFRPGSLLVAAPGAKLQKGDRVAVALASGTLQLREIGRVAGKRYELLQLDNQGRGKPTGKLTVERGQLRLIAKIAQIVE